MKKYIIPTLIIILIVLQVITLTRIVGLQNALRDTKSELAYISSNQSSQSSQMSNIYGNIDSMLKQQSSIIDSYDYQFGTPDHSKNTIPVTFNVTPKVTKADTRATLSISGKSIAMNRNGTTFTATIAVNLFDNLEAKVILADGGIEKTEGLAVSENPREIALPTVGARFEDDAGSGYSKSSGELSVDYHRKGNLILEVKAVENNPIVKAYLVLNIDGKTVSEEQVNFSGIGTAIDKKTTLYAGQSLTMYVTATDRFGFIHKVILDQVVLDKSAEPVNQADGTWIMGEEMITDKDGKVLYR